MIDRRDFLLAATAALAMPKTSAANATDTGAITLRAGALDQQILPTEYAGKTRLLGFNGAVPGPELRVAAGARLRVRLENGLEEGAAVHWHGVRLHNSMDGVPMLTQGLVDPGDRFEYDFVPRDAGTFWYHSHHQSFEQVARGLMGPLIVEEPSPPDVDHDIPVILTDWRLAEDGQLTDDFGSTHDIAHAGRMGNFAKAFLPDLPVKTGARVRLRLINAAVDRVFPVIIKGIAGKIVALDGMPVKTPRAIGLPVLAPAQRVDIIADVTGPIEMAMDHRAGAYPMGTVPVAGQMTPRSAPIPALPQNAMRRPGLITQDLSLKMMGGAMGARHGGGDIWAFNDVSGMQDAPFARFRRGETAKIRLINDTRWPHGIHLHGHHFHEVARDGGLGDFRDTSLVDPGTSRDLICVFDNPGKWMLHCHMLSHQAGGMKTWVEVA